MTVAAQEPKVANSDELKVLLQEYLAIFKHPAGIAALVIHNGNVVAEASAGLRRHDHTPTIQPGDKFHLGSCTKAMTATLVGLAVQRGQLSFDSTLEELLADWKLHPDYEPVTVHMLLQHRSGLPANPSFFNLLFHNVPENDDQRIQQRRRVLEPLLKKSPEHVPGSADSYSNLGYMLLGHLLERQSGKSWETLMREQIFEPLEMTSAGFGPPDQGEDAQQPWGHTKSFGMWTPVNSDNPAYMGPAGTVHMHLTDWSRFARLHLGQQPNALGLTTETLEHLHMPSADNYSAGWIVFPASPDKPLLLFHNGSNTMWYCAICIIPSRQEAVLIASNAYEEHMVHKLMDTLLSVPFSFPPE